MVRFGDEVVVLNNWTLTFDSRGIVIKIFKFYAKRTVMKAGTVIRSPLRGFRFSISGTGVIRLTTRHPTPAFVQIPRPPPASDRLDAHQIFEFFSGETFRREADGGARQRRIDSFFFKVKKMICRLVEDGKSRI